MRSVSVSACLIVLNEEDHLPDCLDSVRWADEIVVVDSGSSDRSREIARRYTDKVYERPFTDFSSQKNAALDQAGSDWVFFIDADERIPSALAEEILCVTRNSGEAPKAYAVGRETYFLGRRLRYSGTQGDFPIRLFPRAQGRFVQPVHEWVKTDLPIGRLNGRLLHYSTRDMAHYRFKLKQYVALEIKTLLQKGRHPGVFDLVFRPPAVFISLYFAKLGILDGWTGFQFAVLSALYNLLKYWCFLTRSNRGNEHHASRNVASKV